MRRRSVIRPSSSQCGGKILEASRRLLQGSSKAFSVLRLRFGEPGDCDCRKRLQSWIQPRPTAGDSRNKPDVNPPVKPENRTSVPKPSRLCRLFIVTHFEPQGLQACANPGEQRRHGHRETDRPRSPPSRSGARPEQEQRQDQPGKQDERPKSDPQPGTYEEAKRSGSRPSRGDSNRQGGEPTRHLRPVVPPLPESIPRTRNSDCEP